MGGLGSKEKRENMGCLGSKDKRENMGCLGAKDKRESNSQPPQESVRTTLAADPREASPTLLGIALYQKAISHVPVEPERSAPRRLQAARRGGSGGRRPGVPSGATTAGISPDSIEQGRPGGRCPDRVPH